MAKKERVEKNSRRTGNRPWKRLFGTDRKYTARVERAMKRGEYTAPNNAAGSRPASWEQTHDTDPQSKSASSGPRGRSGVTLASLLRPSTEA